MCDSPCLVSLLALTFHQRVKALASIGGWTGSRGFSIAVGSKKNRTAFVKTVVDFAKQYKLDGVDFEYVHSPPL